jgi:hypothetical protein
MCLNIWVWNTWLSYVDETALNRHHKGHLGSRSSWVTVPAQFSFLQHPIHWCQPVWSRRRNRSERLAPRELARISRVPCPPLLNHLRYVQVSCAPLLITRVRLWCYMVIHGYPKVGFNSVFLRLHLIYNLCCLWIPLPSWWQRNSNLNAAFDMNCWKLYTHPGTFRIWLCTVQTSGSSEIASWRLFSPDHVWRIGYLLVFSLVYHVHVHLLTTVSAVPW